MGNGKAIVRRALGIIFGMSLCVGFFVRLIPLEAFIPTAVFVVVWFFKSEDEEKNLEEIKEIMRELRK